MVTAFTRLFPNVGESRQRPRQLLATVINSQLIHADLVWANSLSFDRNVIIMEIPQRTMASRVTIAY